MAENVYRGEFLESKTKSQMGKHSAARSCQICFLNGMIGWGLSTAILFALLDTYFERKVIAFDAEFIENLVTSLIIFPVGGIVWGIIVWFWAEKSYRKDA